MSRDVYRRDVLLAFMALILEEEFGLEALDVLMDWRNKRTRKHWKEIARTSGRSDPEYLFSLFNERVHEFEVIRKDAKALEVKVTKCAHADTFKRLNATDIGQKLICNGDYAVVEGFNPKIKFTRPELLMAGDGCCHFKFELLD